MNSKSLLLMIVLFFPIFTFAAAGCDGSGNCYVRAGAGGNGSSWTNACSGFSGSCNTSVVAARGVTYWVSNGSYTCNFSAPDSGTLPVTIKGATITSHGPDATWNNSYAGQALFPGACFIMTDYWTFDGQTRGSDWQSGYTLKVKNNLTGDSFGLGKNGTSGTYHDWNILYFEIEGTHALGDSYTDEGFQCQPTCNNILISHSYIHHAGVDLLSTNYGNSGGTGQTLEYSWLAYNDYARSNGCGGTCHAQGWQTTASNVIVRHNVWQNIMSTSVISDATGAPSPSFSGWEFYGNIVFWDAAFQALSPNVFIGDGLVGFMGGETYTGTLKIYNNTIYGINSTNQACNSSAFVSAGANPTRVTYNNIWAGINSSNCGPYDAPGGVNTMDYNSYFGSSTTNSNDNSAHKQSSSVSPLVNPGASSIAGFSLASDTSIWTPLSSPYASDLTGATRTSSRGAIQYGGVIIPPSGQHNRTVRHTLGTGHVVN